MIFALIAVVLFLSVNSFSISEDVAVKRICNGRESRMSVPNVKLASDCSLFFFDIEFSDEIKALGEEISVRLSIISQRGNHDLRCNENDDFVIVRPIAKEMTICENSGIKQWPEHYAPTEYRLKIVSYNGVEDESDIVLFNRFETPTGQSFRVHVPELNTEYLDLLARRGSRDLFFSDAMSSQSNDDDDFEEEGQEQANAEVVIEQDNGAPIITPRQNNPQEEQQTPEGQTIPRQLVPPGAPMSQRRHLAGFQYTGLPKQLFSNDDGILTSNGDVCVECLEKIEGISELAITKCGNPLHVNCVNAWKEKRRAPKRRKNE